MVLTSVIVSNVCRSETRMDADGPTMVDLCATSLVHATDWSIPMEVTEPRNPGVKATHFLMTHLAHYKNTLTCTSNIPNLIVRGIHTLKEWA